MATALQRRFYTRQSITYVPFSVKTQQNLVQTRLALIYSENVVKPEVSSNLYQIVDEQEAKIERLQQQLASYDRVYSQVLRRIEGLFDNRMICSCPDAAAESLSGLAKIVQQLTEMCEAKYETLLLCAKFYKECAAYNAHLERQLKQFL